MRLKNLAIFLLILFVATVLRFYQLGATPPSLDWDEASLGWNALSLLKTGSDEYGKPVPVSLQSFNDYKPALYAYAAIPSVAIFGLNEFSIRFPSALAGVLTVAITMFLALELAKSVKLSQLASFLLAVSPWHIQFSRVAFEANLALFFFVLGATLLVFFLNRRKWFYLPLSFFFLLSSIYSYHSPRVVVPLFLAGIVIYCRNTFFHHWRIFLVSSALCLLFLYPLARNTYHSGSLSARYQTVAAKLDPATIASNYLRHFNFDFLFLTADEQERHHAPDMGLLYLIEAPFLFTGIYFLIKNRPKFLPFLATWFFCAPIAASLANDAPHAVRSLLFLPTFQIITAYGVLHIPKKALAVLSLLLLANMFYFLHQYFVHLPVEMAQGWKFGYREVVKKVLAVENRYPRIYITSAYDQPYIYFLFYGRISPIIKNNTYFYSGFDKYEFSLKRADPTGFYVFAPEDSPPAGYKFVVQDQVNFPDGTVAFQLGTIKKT